MDERLGPGEQLAGVAGLALILVMFLFAWFGLSVSGANGLDAFDAFGDWFNIILVFTAFSAMSLAVFGGGTARLPFSLSTLTAVLGGVSTIILVIYLISPPGVPTLGGAALELDLDRKLGVWLGLVSTIAVAVGGYMAMQEEGTSFGDAADRLSGTSGDAPPSAGGTPPPPAQQPPPPPPPPGS
jgi:hypothetical protein